VQCFPRLIYRGLCDPDEMRRSAKRSQIEELNDRGETVERHQYTYIMQHDNGFAFMFENLEKDRILLIKMVMNVENLVDQSPKEVGKKPDVIEWRVRLNPGQFEVRELQI